MSASGDVTRLLMMILMTMAKPRNKKWDGLSVFLSSSFLNPTTWHSGFLYYTTYNSFWFVVPTIFEQK